MDWYLAVLKKYAEFEGRARRKEYWMFTLINTIIGMTAAFAAGLFGDDAGIGVLGLVLIVYFLALMIPSLAVAVRRLHDTGRSGWWLLVGIVPLVGPIILLVFNLQDSTPGMNEYGPNPKGVLA